MGCVPPTASDGLAQSDPWSRHGARSAMLRLMITRLTIVMCLLVLGLSLGACTKCGGFGMKVPAAAIPTRHAK
jgi:hypothetical protein